MTELLERGDELEALRGLVGGVPEGVSGIGLVRGPAGAGKTSLLTAASTDAQSRGLRVLQARGSPHEREYPFAVVRQLLDPVLLAASADGRARLFSGAARHAQRLFEPTPEPDQMPAGQPPYATLHGLFWLLAGIAVAQPLLLIVDDVHWCDAASGGFLSFLARRLEGLSLAVLLGQRTEDGAADAWLAELGDDPRTRIVAPRPLSPEAITVMASTALAADVDHDFGHACWQATGGNPFYVRAALDELARESVAPGERPTRVRSLGPETVMRSVLVRLARSPAGAVELAHAVAVLGDGAALRDAAQLAGIPLAQAQKLAEGLTDLGVLVGNGPSVSFAHPIVRNALYRDLTVGARGSLHANAVQMLISAGVDAAEITIHVLRSPPGQPAAVDMLRSAATAASALGAPEIAATYLRRALEEPLDEAERADLFIELGVAEAQSGSGDAVSHLAAGMRNAPCAERRVTAALTLAHVLAAEERAAEGIAMLAELGEDLAESHPQLAARVFSELVSLGDLVDRSLVPARVRRRSPSDGPVGWTHRATELTASVGSATEAGRLAERALANGELLARGDTVFAFACSMLVYAEAFSAAQHHLDQALARAVATGSAPSFVSASGQRALLNARSGKLIDAVADARTALDVTRLHSGKLWQTHTLTMLTEALLAQGRAREAADELAQALQSHEPPADNQGALLLEARGRIRLELGDTEAALDDLLEAGRRLEAWGLHNPAVTAWRSNAAFALATLGQRNRAVALVDAELALTRRWGAPRALGMALRAQALIYNDERTIPLLHESSATLARSQAPIEHARTLTELGAALRRSNQRKQAREHLRAALDLTHAAGALSLAQRAHSELTATGARPRLPLRTGVDALTPSERRISQMAADGQTNMNIAQDLFVTTKTVEMHLTSAYRKLDIASRAELAHAINTHSRS
jgi:DNA-binding CsgD family transcriptional regulator